MSYWDLEFNLNLDEDRAAFPDDVITAPQPAPVISERRGMIDAFLDERIARFVADGVCPMCMNNLEPELVCPVCDFNANVVRSAKTSEPERVSIPLPPHELPFDEYAPAEVDAA